MPSPHRPALSKCEQELIECAMSGRAFNPANRPPSEMRYKPQGRSWGSSRTVRSEIIRALLTGETSALGIKKPAAVPMLSLVSVRVVGDLELESLQCDTVLRLLGCWLDLDRIHLDSARFSGIYMNGCWIDGSLDGRQLVVASDLNIARSTIDSVDIPGASIGGVLNATYARISPKSGTVALNADGLVAKGGVALGGVRCTGEVRLLRADIGRQFSISSALLDNRGDDAMSLDGSVVDGNFVASPDVSILGTLRLQGMEVKGQVLLTGARLEATHGESVLAQRCVIAGDVFADELTSVGVLDLSNTRIEGDLSLSGSRLDGGERASLIASSARIEGSLYLDEGFRSRGEIALPNSHVGGDLALEQSEIASASGRAFTAPGMQIEGDLSATRDSHIRGAMTLSGADIGGDMVLPGAKLWNPGAIALIADRIHVHGNMHLGGNFSADGGVRISSGVIDGQTSFTGARVSNPGAIALGMDGAHLEGDFIAQNGTEFYGALRLPSTKIGGQLRLGGAFLINPGGTALVLDSADIAENAYINSGFIALGMTSLVAAHFRGQLLASHARFSNPGAIALCADGVSIEGGLFANTGFSVNGEIRMIEAKVGSQMGVTGASLYNPQGHALLADGLEVRGNLMMSGDFTARGAVRLVGASISSQLVLAGSTLTAGPDGVALNAEHLRVGNSLFWTPAEMKGAATFSFARVGVWVDDRASLFLPCAVAGLSFDRLLLGPDKISVGERLDWIGRDPSGYAPATYKHLSENLRKGGHDSDARKVLIASERARRRSGINVVHRVGNSLASGLLRWTVGYGYRPWRAVGWLLGLVTAAALVLARLPGGAERWFEKTAGAPHPFNTLLYTVDAVLPFIDLGYSRWVPNGTAQFVVITLVILGWILATAVVAALAGLLRRGD